MIVKQCWNPLRQHINAEGETVTEYKDYKAEPEDDKVSYNVAYKSSDKNFTIDEPLTSNCTLVGQWNEDIYIKPNPGQSIWVTLYNFTLEGHRIIVDNTTHATNPGVVYFFVPEKGSVSYVAGEAGATFGSLVETPGGAGACTGNLDLNNASIITSYYANLNEAIDLTLYPLTLEGGAERNRPKIPNIYIYMAGGKKASEIESEVAPKLISNNQSVITGYICAPYIALEFWNPRGTGGSGASIKYNETVVTKENIAVIGQVIVGDIEQFTNNNIVVQVSPNISGGGGPRPGEVIGGQWTELENTYGFGS